ncbi:MAG TPA: TerB family tellurite resistance protein [Flavobacterium sp.]|nr:TerB family tellurite resistance protein [Flavobacterium sp.]
MKISADKQFQKITIEQIKTILKNQVPDQFDKMIISENQEFKRADYSFSKMKFQKVEREIQFVKFPLYDAVTDNFKEIEGGEKLLGQKAVLKNDNLLKILNQKFKINGSKLDKIHIENPLKFPFDEINNEINPIQRKYFFPDLSYKESCPTCITNKYVGCPDSECKGRHDYTCPSCNGSKKVDCKPCKCSGFIKCDQCRGSGECKCSKCGGKGEIKCGSGFFDSGCNGTGMVTVNGKQQRCKKCSGRGIYPCSDCRQGIVNCSKCAAKGELRCENCNGRGEINCDYCRAQGTIICKTCYGDKDRYGMVDCPTCNTMGLMAQLVYVETTVSNDSIDKLTFEGETISVVESDIKKHIITDAPYLEIYKRLNAVKTENYDEYSLKFATNFESDLKLNKTIFPLVVKEQMSYQIIPCVEIAYKHIITNEEHNLTIIDIWSNPEVIFQSDAEELKQNIGNATKAVGGFFGKLFKTNNFKTKEDKRNEIILLIYLAKVDGKMEEQEKIFLSEMIGNLNEFTNTEKQLLFDLMNASVLPELTVKETAFSSKERANEVMDKLNQLAASDGEIEATEKILIDKIMQLIKS